jgi:hypothetical protein
MTQTLGDKGKQRNLESELGSALGIGESTLNAGTEKKSSKFDVSFLSKGWMKSRAGSLADRSSGGYSLSSA